MKKRNVIYINCWTDPWIKVAHELDEKFGFQPVYWIGYSSYTDKDNADEVVPKEFPNAKYVDNLEAWMGRFPDEIIDAYPDYYLDVNFLNRHANHELQAIKMMDRVDPDRYSFNFMERQRHFRKMMKQCMAILDTTKPDLIISTAIPHRLYDYVLYWLCEEKQVPFLTIVHTQFSNRYFFAKNNFYTIGKRFVEDWHSFEKQECLVDKISKDIYDNYLNIHKEYCDAVPYMSAKEYTVKFDGTLKTVSYYIRRAFRGQYTFKTFFVAGNCKDVYHYYLCKNRKMTYEDSHYSVWQQMRFYIKSIKYKKELLNYYESQCSKPDYNVPYVCFFLHYQPEATTCPGGDVFVDQSLCVELLLKHLPSSYYVYVKEHPHQFLANRPGHSCRMKDLYDDLKLNSRVRLISTKENPFELIKHAKAISTITGTVGWEAIVRQKPVIVFGLCWYENFTKGVLRITDEASARCILGFIENYEFDEHSLLAYLAAVGKNTSLAYYFKGMGKDTLNLPEEECVNNIVSSILDALKGNSLLQIGVNGH